MKVDWLGIEKVEIDIDNVLEKNKVRKDTSKQANTHLVVLVAVLVVILIVLIVLVLVHFHRLLLPPLLLRLLGGGGSSIGRRSHLDIVGSFFLGCFAHVQKNCLSLLP